MNTATHTRLRSHRAHIVQEGWLYMRLGDDRGDMTLDPQQDIPLDPSRPTARVVMTERRLPGAEPPEAIELMPPNADVFEFRVGDRRFRDVRLGLRWS